MNAPAELGTSRERARAAVDLAWCAAIHAAQTALILGVLPWISMPLAPGAFAALILASHGTLLLGTLLVLSRRGQWLADVGAARPPRGWIRPIALLVPTQLAMWGMLLPIAAVLLWADRQPATTPFAGGGELGLPLLVAAAAFIGFVEELMFRGLILDRAIRLFSGAGRRRGVVAAVVGTSLWFGVGHAGQGIGGVVVTTSIGMFLSWVVLRSRGNLVLAMLVHALQDTIALLLARAA